MLWVERETQITNNTNKQTNIRKLVASNEYVEFSWTMDFHMEENAFYVCNVFAAFIHYNAIKSNWITLFHSIKWANSKCILHIHTYYIQPRIPHTDWVTEHWVHSTQTTNLWMNNILNWNLNRMRSMNRAMRPENNKK